ncbi:phosphoribosylformylglycinamidine cyclo-ligase [Paenibacillus dendritiformis]|uniref:phosphoribosylformylglycinamidine cyclo-ligase n=1 Tax=Paenibacillus dendritiformis TaxID=130049 RepID=UPI00248AB6A8|nr:phosphoribosylformylglycinamidine cyclo-ligase [Paenibacillus dendritiformis]WGU92546.1 phosphoribosylformylglycinamidine cyclo-ligase [Paenibacillus dendritiformis]
MSEAYKQAGVDIAAGNEAVERMKKHVQRTFRPEVLSGLGGFGALFGLDAKKYEEPVLVSGTDGVGTKLMLAFAADRHDTIGIDAVAMCVNDIVVQGAEPLFFLDYLACGQVVPERIEAIVSGIAEGCRMAGCALIGGETAEMPGMYAPGEYDIAGFSVGIVEKRRLITGATIRPGDVLLGLASSGFHSNGYSLVRKLFLQEACYTLDARVTADGRPLGDVLLEPTRIYVRPLLELMNRVPVKGAAHITGGGFLENIPRMLPEGTAAQIDYGTWPVPEVFRLSREIGSLTWTELFTTFNMGIGMVIAVSADEAAAAEACLMEQGEAVYRIGTVTEGERQVRIPEVGC